MLGKNAPDRLLVQHVSGNVELDLRSKDLGTLTELHSIGKDLRYCAPELDQAALNAWIDTIAIGGSVINTCE